MAIILPDLYPGRANPVSVDYPQGSFKDRSAPGAMDGTPLKADWANDKEGFFQALIKEAEITPNGEVDTSENSQYFDALQGVISKTVPFATQSEFDSHSDKNKAVSPFVMQPSMDGNAALTGSDNVVAMDNIVSTLGLEKGDVIQIKINSPEYDKLHTVESITNDGQIVVNYEHCGTRGNGPLKLPDYTGQVTIKRIAKWFNAAPGLGQAWVSVSDFRSLGVNVVNSTGREILSSFSSSWSNGPIASIIVNGVRVAFVNLEPSSANEVVCAFASVPSGADYSYITDGEGSIYICSERR